jgi:L-serine/L-threonine ammonia-lyase
VPIFAVETLGAASYHAALRAGRPVEIDRIASVATSLGARRVCERSIEWSKERSIHSLLVSDRNALAACERFLLDHRLVVEPACGASLAPLYDGAFQWKEFKNVLVEVCGGATATVDQIRHWMDASA